MKAGVKASSELRLVPLPTTYHVPTCPRFQGRYIYVSLIPEGHQIHHALP